jgi:VirB8 protein
MKNLFATPIPAAAGQPPEAVSVIVAQNRTIAILTGVIIAMALITGFALLGMVSATKRFATESRLTYVKLDPTGAWSISQDMDASVLYYDATLRQVLYDWIERRYSERPATVLEDWGIANATYSPAMQAWFLKDFGAHAQASKIAECLNCSPVFVKVRSHQHVDPLPTDPGSNATTTVRTLVYADRTKGPQKERKIYRVTWRLLPKSSIQQRPDVLRYNPIGLEILEVEENTDETPAP